MFSTHEGITVPAVTRDQMREVDRIAVEEFGLDILQMMENAGRGLALNVFEMLGLDTGEVTVLAGSGGNGGGGLCCARHLHNHGFKVNLFLDREPARLRGPALQQYRIIARAGVEAATPELAERLIAGADLVIDALIGYSLLGPPRGRVAELIEICNRTGARALSLDLPSGMNATSGETPGAAIRPERTFTLALPKTGLRKASGELYLADIGIPPAVYQPLGIRFEPIFGVRYYLPLRIVEPV